MPSWWGSSTMQQCKRHLAPSRAGRPSTTTDAESLRPLSSFIVPLRSAIMQPLVTVSPRRFALSSLRPSVRPGIVTSSGASLAAFVVPLSTHSHLSSVLFALDGSMQCFAGMGSQSIFEELMRIIFSETPLFLLLYRKSQYMMVCATPAKHTEVVNVWHLCFASSSHRLHPSSYSE